MRVRLCPYSNRTVYPVHLAAIPLSRKVTHNNFALLIHKAFAKGPKFDFAFGDFNSWLGTFDTVMKDPQDEGQRLQIWVLVVLFSRL